MPTLLIFPLVLFATRFFTPGERQRLGRMLHRRRGRATAEPARPQAARPRQARRRRAAAVCVTEGGAPVDRARHLSADDEEAEEEELEMEKEADVDFIEGPTTTTIT